MVAATEGSIGIPGFTPRDHRFDSAAKSDGHDASG